MVGSFGFLARFGFPAGCLLAGLTASHALAEEQAPFFQPVAVEQVTAENSPPPAPAYQSAPPAAMYVSPYAGDLWNRPVLLGDLGGHRDALAQSGFTFNLSSTQFYQGVTSGGVRQEFLYSGRNDYLVNVDGEHAGLWRGFFINLHGESRYGNGINADTGAIIPANTGSLFPVPAGAETALTGVKLTQALSENFLVFAGKINTLDGLTQQYAGGRGVDAFMNMGLAFPVAAARTIPYSTLGGGFAVLRELQPIFTCMVLDTENTPMRSGFETFFENGTTVLARLETPVTLFDRPGHQAIWGTYSSGTYNSLQGTPYFDPTGQIVIPINPQTGSWSMTYSADQALFVDPCNPKRSWGVFTNLGIADNDPSPIQFAANVGLGGSSPIVSRPLDTFGIGYAYTGFAGQVRNFAPVVLPVGNDQVVELFYNYAVTPWFRVTPDFQIILPARERTLPPGSQNIDTALVFGFRAKLDF